eukprot:217697-Chlamydomonas_euryale.AAC.1
MSHERSLNPKPSTLNPKPQTVNPCPTRGKAGAQRDAPVWLEGQGRSHKGHVGVKLHTRDAGQPRGDPARVSVLLDTRCPFCTWRSLRWGMSGLT